MKRIIDIPETVYEKTKEDGYVLEMYLEMGWDAIKNSTPLTQCNTEDCISRAEAIKEFCKQTCETPNCRFRDKGVVHASCDEVDVLKRLPNVLPKADNSEDNQVTLSFSKGTLKFSCKDYVVYKKDWFRSHYGAEIDIMCGDKQYLSDNSVLEDIKAEIDEHIEYNTKMNYMGIVSGLALSKDIIDKHISGKEDNG